MGSFILRFAAGTLASIALLAGADFTYEQKTEITGGSMKRMMDMAARFSRQAAGPQTTTHRYSGDKMSVQAANATTVYDLAADTITQIDHGKKEYSVIGFAEMMELTKALMSKFNQGQDQGVQVNWKATVDLTGKTKPVAGVDTKEAVLKVEMEAQDASKAKSGVTSMDMDMWIGAMPGYQAVRDFQRKMAAKMSLAAGVNPMMMSQMGSGGMNAMMEAGKKIAELDGIPLETIMRMKGMMGVPGMSQRRPEASEQQQSTETAQVPSTADVKDAAKERAAEAAAENTASRVTRGRLGGLGGNMGGMLGGRLGRGKKKEEAQPAPQAQPEPAPAAAPAPAPAANPAPASGSDQLAIESVTTVTSFNSNPVDPAAFTVPAGYKQVEHPLKKTK
ncbi:MAG: hypothetical protein IT168_31800 [Bryobacterales bacterium]|nr:hypothetical protein [Bryobacterales bacterium]